MLSSRFCCEHATSQRWLPDDQTVSAPQMGGKLTEESSQHPLHEQPRSSRAEHAIDDTSLHVTPPHWLSHAAMYGGGGEGGGMGAGKGGGAGGGKGGGRGGGDGGGGDGARISTVLTAGVVTLSMVMPAPLNQPACMSEVEVDSMMEAAAEAASGLDITITTSTLMLAADTVREIDSACGN